MEDGSVVVELAFPTIFADFNEANGHDDNHFCKEVRVQRLKFKHFKQLQSVNEKEQMFEALSLLTGLSQDDIGELDAEDAAEITSVVYGFMEKFMKVARKMMGKG